MERCSGTSASCFALAVLNIFVITSWAARVDPHGKTSTEFIRTSCGVTTYPRVCIESLSAYASAIQTSPTEMAHAALSVCLKAARSTSAMMSKLSTEPGMTPKEVVVAMRDCIEVMRDSVDELQRSIGAMGQLSGPNFGLHINDIQTWVSAALTEEDTCMDGFAGNNKNGNLKNEVRGHVVNVAHMTSNALALVNNLAST